MRSRPKFIKNVPPLLKWTGSKRSQASIIVSYMPVYRRYFEPFLGGGAVLFFAAEHGATAGDAYEPLIAFWKLVQRDPELVVDDYRRQWDALQKDLPSYYYQVRARFNQSPNPLDLSFLMRTCVNGIVRFNEQGQFNNSFHLSRKGMQPGRFSAIVREWHAAVQGIKFVHGDYADTLQDAESGDFVYMDPPYAGNKQRYSQDLDLDRFFNVLEQLNRRGVYWALSFDGKRGDTDLAHPVPGDLYRRKHLIPSGNSPVHKVLNGPVEMVYESLYLNY